MLHGGDKQWWLHYWREIDASEGERWTISDAMRGVPGIHWIQGVADAEGLSSDPMRIHAGGNSGYQALGLAALWGCSRVILLGFDMKPQGKRLHAHPDHPAKLGNPGVGTLAGWAQRFAAAAHDLRRLGIEAVNCSRDTAIACFPRRPLEEQLGERPAIVVNGMAGLGDNLFQRPFVRELARSHEVYLRTPWPQLYSDLAHVHPLRSETRLRTQAKNEQAHAEEFEQLDGKRVRDLQRSGAQQRTVSYIRALQRRASIWEGLAETFGCSPRGGLDLPPLPELPVSLPQSRPMCLVRPVSVRHEWTNTARNPEAQQVAEVARWLREEEGMVVVSVADLASAAEFAVPPLPEADYRFHRGELDALQLLALVKASAAVVGGVGWIVPAAIAARVPAFFLLGGQGGHNAPEVITDPSMPLDLIGWGVPDAFCRCTAMRHECRKTNSRLREQFDEWRLRVACRAPAAVAA